MKQLTMKSADLTQINIGKIAELFPNVITEARDGQGKIKREVDFDLLKQELSDYLVEGEKERFQLTWPGKKEAILNANIAIDKSLRPIKTESVDWNTTENMYIEGDNLDVLKLLQESYLNKIKTIYIDPPYNTGKDFIYKDNFREPQDEYLEESGQVDEAGNRLFQNTEVNGRFHSDWLTMMYSRLKIARNLLREDGVIFISIDDSEIENLKKICNEIYGEVNFRGTIVRATGQTTGQDSGGLGSSFDYILAYTKNTDVDFSGLPLTEHDLKRFENEDDRGRYAFDQMRKTGSNDRREDRPNMYYAVKDPDGNDVYPIAAAGYESCWRFERKTYERLLSEGFILWKKTKRGEEEIWWPYVKYYLEGRTKRPSPLWDDLEGNKKATRDVRALFDGAKVFDHSKPVDLLKRLILISPNSNKEDLVLDFFSGSASTADAVMQLNAGDGGNRKFIMVQLPEIVDESTDAYKAGYKNICEIGKERIRRAAKKIKEETGAGIDYGFRVYRVDSSNMKDVYYTPDKLGQMYLDEVASNIKEDRTGEDLLIQVMLECGLELSLPMETKEVEGKTMHYVAGNSLIACFDDEVTESLIKKIAEDQPLRVVFRDSSFGDDSARINVEELFKLLSPSTEIQVL